MTDSGYRAFHNDCGGMVAFGIGGDGFCVECEDENVEFSDYTLAAVKPSAGITGAVDESPADRLRRVADEGIGGNAWDPCTDCDGRGYHADGEPCATCFGSGQMSNGRHCFGSAGNCTEPPAYTWTGPHGGKYLLCVQHCAEWRVQVAATPLEPTHIGDTRG